MSRLFCVSMALAWAASPALAQAPGSPPASAPRREVFADCAAAYRANWQNRLSDPGRAPSMSAMISDPSEQYKRAAIGHYEIDRKASKDGADRNVSAHVKSNVERFVSMDKAGTLEAYIEMCPQPEKLN
jgi:hypothetical protein